MKLEEVSARGLKRTGGAGCIEIRLDRVAVWTLIFTNAFFLGYFFARLFRWI